LSDYHTADPIRRRAENQLIVVDYPFIKTRDYEDFRQQVVNEFSNEKFAGLPHVTAAEDVRTVLYSYVEIFCII
jgi:hypothetical protein